MSSDKSKKWPQYLFACSLNLISFATGLHTGWPAPSLPKLLSDEYPHELTNDEASYVVIIALLGNICGGFMSTLLLDKIGRNRTALLIAFPLILTWLLIISSYQVVELLYLGRLIGGVAEGMSYTSTPLYIAEVAQPAIRGSLGVLISVLWLSGMLFANIVGSNLSVKNSATIFLVFPVIFLLMFRKMPESPYYLLMKNKVKEAEASLKFLHGKKDVSKELTNLSSDVNRQMSESGTFRDIFLIDSNKKALFIVVTLRIFQQFTGVSAFGFYIQILLKEAIHYMDPFIGSSILIFVELLMCVLSTFFVDKLGRKPLIIFSSVGCFLNLTLQAIYFALKEHTDVDLSSMDLFPLVMMVLFMIIYFPGLGVICNVYAGEIFSTSIKSKAMCFVNAAFALSTLTTTKFYQVTADKFGFVVPFSCFALITIFGVLFEYFWLPETKGRSLEQIQQKLKGHKDKHTNKT